jgi:VWFA-related protein
MRQTESNLSPLYAGRAKYAVLLSLLCAPLAAQTGEAATSELKIKTETRLVLVDAVVTAKKDELVGDLTAKNFHVFADGKEQPITAFQAHAGNATGEIGRQQRILLLFDGRSTEDPVWIEQAVEKFAADNAGPNRPIAVAYYDGGCMTFAAQFTTDVGQLRHALSDWSQTRHCPPIADPQGSHRAEQYSGLAKNLAKLPGHKVVVLFSGRAMQQQSAGGDIGAELSTTRAGGGKDVDVGNGRPDIPGALGSAGMGGGAPAPSSRAPDSSSRALVEPTGMQLEFRKADVSVYTVEGQAGARAPSWAVTLAEKTGGHDLSHGNDIGNALGSIVREHDQGYTLGFVPVDSPEGSCHPLKITVNQPKVKVRGRDLYCNVPETNLATGGPVGVALESLANAAPSGNVKAALSLPSFYQNGAPRVNLVLEIPAPALEPIEASGKLYASMDVLGLAYNAKGGVAARFGDTVRYDFDNRRQFDEFVRQPLHYEYLLKVAPGSYGFKLVFRLAKDRVGVVEAPLAVEPFDAARLAISSIALSRDTQPIAPEAAQAETDAGRKPLVYHGKRITPTASDVLAKNGVGQAYFEVYAPPAKGAEPVKLSMCLRVFDVPGNQKKVDSGDIDLSALAKSGGGAIPVGLRLPISALAVGSYRAEISVKDSAGGEAARSVQFRVE